MNKLGSFLDLSNPSKKTEAKKHKLKRLIQSPNSHYIATKCLKCKKINIIFSHSVFWKTCVDCSTLLTRPSGGKFKSSKSMQIVKRLLNYQRIL
ncbi:ribosomal protein S27 (nucleomorph) [Bigelowiella natans]|uniref:40S ribosomal protein S27 n=1 Tax=Bigelowiella natans TaxID=227086 RepID=Q3LW62_BIGNA|nr:ribosomal protein S27 [Bigelowiella natans]ABA27304.1 ribosomal protein S27 [Bigelowiella natans]